MAPTSSRTRTISRMVARLMKFPLRNRAESRAGPNASLDRAVSHRLAIWLGKLGTLANISGLFPAFQERRRTRRAQLRRVRTSFGGHGGDRLAGKISVQVARQQCGDCELPADHRPGIEVVVASTLAQPIEIDVARGVAGKCISAAANEKGLEAQFELGLCRIDHLRSPMSA